LHKFSDNRAHIVIYTGYVAYPYGVSQKRSGRYGVPLPALTVCHRVWCLYTH